MKGGEHMTRQTIAMSALVMMLMIGVMSLAPASVQAQTPTSAPSTSSYWSKLVQMIATKFNLNTNDVQGVVTQFHQDRRQERWQKQDQMEENRLDQLVKDGKITSAQKQAILGEISVLQKKYLSVSDVGISQEDRARNRLAMHEDLISWAKSQGIDPIYVMPGFGLRMGGHPWGGRHMMGK